MPLKLNVGLSRKLGRPQYSSVGAQCHMEVELPGSLLEDDLDGLHRHIRGVYTACRQAVQDELARYQAAAGGNGSPGNGSRENGARRNGSRDHAAVSSSLPVAPEDAQSGDGFPSREEGDGANGTQDRGIDAGSDAGIDAGSAGGNGAHGNHRPGASQRQIEYIHQLARQIRGLGTRRLDALSEQLLGKPIAGLASRDASELIAGLRALRDGEIALEDVFEGDTP